MQDWKRILRRTFRSCKALLLSMLLMTGLEPWVTDVIQQVLDLMTLQESDLGSAGYSVFQGLLQAYLVLHDLHGGSAVRLPEGAVIVREASRELRDAVMSSCWGIMKTTERDEAVDMLIAASDGMVGCKGNDGENTLSALVKALVETYGDVVTFTGRIQRKKKARNNRKRAKEHFDRERAEQAHLEEQAQQYNTQIQMHWCMHVHMQQCAMNQWQPNQASSSTDFWQPSQASSSTDFWQPSPMPDPAVSECDSIDSSSSGSVWPDVVCDDDDDDDNEDDDKTE
jgi:hypothetical protein